MRRLLLPLVFLLALSPALTRAQKLPTLVVHTFVLAPGVSWPYDMNNLQLETFAQLLIKDSKIFNVLLEAPKDSPPSYVLEGEVLEWHAGNRAERALVGMGAGRETAKIHFWLTGRDGKKVYEHTDVIRQSFTGDVLAASRNQLVRPFAEKVASRLAEAKFRN